MKKRQERQDAGKNCVLLHFCRIVFVIQSKNFLICVVFSLKYCIIYAYLHINRWKNVQYWLGFCGINEHYSL